MIQLFPSESKDLGRCCRPNAVFGHLDRRRIFALWIPRLETPQHGIPCAGLCRDTDCRCATGVLGGVPIRIAAHDDGVGRRLSYSSPRYPPLANTTSHMGS